MPWRLGGPPLWPLPNGRGCVGTWVTRRTRAAMLSAEHPDFLCPNPSPRPSPTVPGLKEEEDGARERERDAAIINIKLQGSGGFRANVLRSSSGSSGEPVGRTFRVLTMQRTHTHGLQEICQEDDNSA